MNKTFLTLGVAGLLICNIPTMSVKAISNTNTTVLTESQTRAAGLIIRYELTLSSSSGKLCVNGVTKANGSMKSISYKDISIEYSSDGVNWSEEKTIDDLLKSDSSSYYLNNYDVSVKGGYYYHVKLTHYAKEKGLFGSSQSVENTSNSVWIS